MKITFGKKVYNNQKINSVLKQSKRITQMGKYIKKFEKNIFKFFKKKYCVISI